MCKSEIMTWEQIKPGEDIPLLDRIYMISGKKTKHGWRTFLVAGENKEGWKRILNPSLADIIEIHGGDIRIESPESNLYTFWMHDRNFRFRVDYNHSDFEFTAVETIQGGI